LSEIENLKRVAIPKYFTLDGQVLPIYDEKTDREITRVESLLGDYIKTNYTELIEDPDFEENRHTYYELVSGRVCRKLR
jgi:hypothetical protein